MASFKTILRSYRINLSLNLLRYLWIKLPIACLCSSSQSSTRGILKLSQLIEGQKYRCLFLKTCEIKKSNQIGLIVKSYAEIYHIWVLGTISWTFCFLEICYFVDSFICSDEFKTLLVSSLESFLICSIENLQSPVYGVNFKISCWMLRVLQ